MRKCNEHDVGKQDGATFEAIWLSALERLPAETEQALPEGLETRILAVVRTERARQKPRTRVIRWPAAFATVAAAALVVWLVVPGILQNKPNELGMRQAEPPHAMSTTEADNAEVAEGMLVGDEAAPASIEQAVEPESRAMVQPDMPAPYMAELDADALTLTLKSGGTLILQTELAEETSVESLPLDETMEAMAFQSTWWLTSLEDLEQIDWLDELTRSERRRFDAYLSDAFAAGDAVIVSIEE